MMWLILAGILGSFSVNNAFAEWKSSVNADLTAEGMFWTSGKLPPDNKTVRGIYTLKVPMSFKNGRTLRFRFLPLVQVDPENASTTDPQHPNMNERYYWDLQEGFMQLQWLPFTTQIGFNVQTWGDTDVFNPLDVVNARRFYDPFRSEKLGAATVLMKYEWEKLFLEAIYIPRQRETLLPGENSRWLPRDVYKSRSFEGRSIAGTPLTGRINLPADLRYHYRKSGVATAALNDNFGLRMKFRFPGFDWTLAGFQGAATTPSVNIDQLSVTTNPIVPGTTAIDLTVDPDLFLKALYYKTRMTGTSFVWVLGDFLVKGASAYTAVLGHDGKDNFLPKDAWENALGLERTFSVGNGSLTALVQGTYVDRNEKLDSNSVSLARMFDRGIMGALRWAPTERLTALASFLHDMHYRGDLYHADVSYKIKDGWLGKVGADIIEGIPETPLGTYRKNDRVVVSLNVTK